MLAPSGSARRLLAAMGRDAAPTEDGRYRLSVEAVTDYAFWVFDPNRYNTILGCALHRAAVLGRGKSGRSGILSSTVNS
jgi:hypothetical protein